MAGLLVGIDMGTTRVKAVAVDPRDAVCGEAAAPTPWRRDGPHTEADPEALVRLAQRVAAEAAAGVPGGTVLGIGVTGMAETGVLVDGHDAPLAPAIAWYDPRGDTGTIARELGTDIFETTTGLPLTVLPSLAKLLWLRRAHPATARAVRFYSVPEWVVRRFGGAPVTELSLASRTGLLELPTARVWGAALDLLGRPGLVDEAVLAGTTAGRVGAGADVPPVLRGAALTVAGHDHQVAAYGLGAVTDGAVLDSLGTAEALVRTVRPPLPPARVASLAAHGISVGWSVVADHLCVLAGIPTGLTLNRLAGALGVASTAARRALAEQALAAPPTDPPPRLVDVRGDRFGLADIPDGVTPGLLWRVATEALAEQSQRVLDRVDELTGPHGEVVVAGGWLHDPAILAAKRRQFPAMRTTDITEPGAYGAALLAGTTQLSRT